MVPSLFVWADEDLTELFANHTFVGIADSWRRLAAIQHGVKLYLVDYGAVWYSSFEFADEVTNSSIKLVFRSLITLVRLSWLTASTFANCFKYQ